MKEKQTVGRNGSAVCYFLCGKHKKKGTVCAYM